MEHCKTGEYFGPFTQLQTKILKSMYNNILSKQEKYMYFNVYDDNTVINFYFSELPIVFQLLGDVLCKTIPDFKTMTHSQDDVDAWARTLYKMWRKNEK